MSRFHMYIQLYHIVCTNTFFVWQFLPERLLDSFSSTFVRATQKKVGIYFATVFWLFFNIFEVSGHIESCESPRQLDTQQQSETNRKSFLSIQTKRKITSIRTPYGENIKQPEGGNVGDFSYWHKKSSACQPWQKKVVACIFYRCIFHFNWRTEQVGGWEGRLNQFNT